MAGSETRFSGHAISVIRTTIIIIITGVTQACGASHLREETPERPPMLSWEAEDEEVAEVEEEEEEEWEY